MVFFNYATMQMAAKIVYYGPGLCGKTTNLHLIYSRTAPSSRGEMVSLETETDRTLFFDLLPIDVGVIGGFKTRLQLYTVPGQVFYNTTRKLVLKGVDGIVFVADSQIPMLEANKESFRNLVENLAEIGLSLKEIPIVLQYNKRDLTNILPPEDLHEALNPDRAIPFFEASARNGTGVFETLKGISKLTLRSLKSRMSDEPKRPVVFATVAPKAEAPPLAVASVFPGGTAAETLRTLPEPDAVARAREEGDEVTFAETAAKSVVEEDEAPVKHVHLRSNVDILTELEKIRKLATQSQTTPSGPFPPIPPPIAPASEPSRVLSGRSGSLSLDDILGKLPKNRDVARSFDLSIPRAALGQTRQVTVTLRFDGGLDGSGAPAEREVTIDLSKAKDLQKLSLSLKINVQGE